MATQHIITLDFETFYDTKFSLSRLTTEEYVRDNQFDIIGVGIKIDTEPAYWVSGPSDLLNKHLLSLGRTHPYSVITQCLTEPSLRGL